MRTAVNAKNALFASPIHAEFTLRLKVTHGRVGDLALSFDDPNDSLSDSSDAVVCSHGESIR